MPVLVVSRTQRGSWFYEWFDHEERKTSHEAYRKSFAKRFDICAASERAWPMSDGYRNEILIDKPETFFAELNQLK
jgi:hypothetical protein